jgi:hypothetical protein
LNPKVGETSKYLSVTQGIEQDIKEYKKTISDNDFANGITQESLLKLAIKYGKGEFDKKIWQYRYKVTLSKGKVYNTFLAMAKHNASNGAASDYDYSGTFPKSDVRWVQSRRTASTPFLFCFLRANAAGAAARCRHGRSLVSATAVTSMSYSTLERCGPLRTMPSRSTSASSVENVPKY